MGEDLERLKQRLPLLDYLRQQNWVARPTGHGSELVGLCPLHRETRPSFYVNTRKNLFYCHGCGQGDLIRFVELSEHLSFRQSLSYLEQQAIPSIGCGAPVSLTPKVTTLSTSASSSPATRTAASSTFTVAAPVAPVPIDFSPAPRAAWSLGNRFATFPA